jgi:dienelactone hydrolase
MKHTNYCLRFMGIALGCAFLLGCATPAITPTAFPVPSETVSSQSIFSSTSTPASTELIRPGDIVDGVLVTTGQVGNDMMFDIPCEKKGDVDSCTQTLGRPINITAVVYEETPEKLQAAWNTFEYTLMINGQQVDLAAFGTIDFIHERTGLYMRAYNVVLIAENPATITTYDVGSIVPDGPFEFKGEMIFASEVNDDPIQPLSSAADRSGQHPYTSERTDFQLLLYVPEDYGNDPNQTWPLILFLHGGPNVQSLDWVRIKPIAVQLDNDPDFPFIVASPLHTGEYQHWSTPEVQEDLLTLIAELESVLRIDPNRISLVGFIEGANGVWELGLAHPDLFAALVPISGWIGYPYSVPDTICDLKDMPIWAFHGALDADLPPTAQQMLVDALTACGSNITFTVYPDAGFEVFHAVLADTALYDWLLLQSR